MRKLLLFLALLVTAIGGSAIGMTVDEALGLFENGQVMIEYSDAGAAQLVEIIAALRDGLGVTDALNEQNEGAVMGFDVAMESKDIVNKLSQAYYTLANVFTPDNENEGIYLKGKHWGLKSLRMNPEFNDLEGGRFDESVARETDVPALYWTAANWLRVAQKNPLQAVFAGVPAKTQALSERALALEPGYIAGGAYRSLGAYYSGLPIGKDLDKALSYLCHVVDEPACSICDIQARVEDADAYFENRTFIAEFYYMEKGMWEDAARVLQSVLDEQIGDVYALMNAYAQENAAGLMVEVEKHL